MRLLILFVAIAACTMSCGPTNYELKDLYGKWEGNSMSLTMNEDGSCDMFLAGEKYPGDTRWRAAMGNTLEFTVDGKVFMANVTVKSLKDDVLEIETRPMMTKKDLSTVVHEMKRVKE